MQDRTLLGGTNVVYMPLVSAQSVGLGGRPLVTAVVTTGTPRTVPAGLQAFSTPVAEQRTLDSLASAVSSINNTKILMWIIAGIIIAALLYVSALQTGSRLRRAQGTGLVDLAAARKPGSASGGGVVAGRRLRRHHLQLHERHLPVSRWPFRAVRLSALPIIAVVVGLIASLVALRQATGADPAAAFG